MSEASLAQQGIWFTEQAVDAGSCYHLAVSMAFEGGVEAGHLLDACRDVVARHPMLGMAVSEDDGQPSLVPGEPVEVRQAPSGEDDLMVETVRRFDLRRGPLARFTLFDGGRLLFVAHHLVFDGESKDVLVRDLAGCYAARVSGEEPDRSPVAGEYATHVVGERERVEAGLAAAQRFWADRPRPSAVALPGLLGDLLGDRTSTEGGEVRIGLSGPIALRAKELGISSFELLLGALHCLLWRYGNEQPAVAVDISTRTPPHRHAVGVFVNELPVHGFIEPGMTFRAFAARLHRELRGIYAHYEVPLARAVTGIPPGTALAPVSISYRKRPPEPPLPGVKVDWIGYTYAARNALHLQVVEGPDGPVASFQYGAHRLERAGAEAIADHYATLLAGILADPDAPVDALPLLSETERAELLGGTEAGYPDRTTLHQLIEEQAARTPDATAVVFEAASLTYAQLNAHANGVAKRLRALGAGPESIVAITAERSLELVAGLLGILKAGAAYLPLDPDLPQARLDFMLADAKPLTVLTREQLHDGSDENPPPAAGPDNAAYVIYTSGSTGRPKGVVNTHRGILNRLHWTQLRYHMESKDVVLQKTPASFDVSVWEFFWPLMVGASLVLARPGGHRDAGYLRDLIAGKRVTVTHFVPSMLAAFLDQEGIEKCDSLRTVICSGEELQVDLARRFTSRLDAQLHNLYGPTEAAIDVSHWHCAPGTLEGVQRVPIGHPIANTRLLVLDAAMNLVPRGVAGELHIGGVGVARGYLSRPALTAQRFVPDPYGPPGSRLYRTGDLARHRSDGTLEFLGRLDHQVKLRGQRIELGEIEAVLMEDPSVRQAAVVLRDDRLVAYVTGTSNVEELRQALRRELPGYMIPAAFVALERMPLSANGKLDRGALPPPQPEKGAVKSAEPRTEAERLLARLWGEVLKAGPIGIDDDFFDLGGHSLLATRVVSRLRRELPPDSPRVTVMDLFERSTIRELAPLLETAHSLPKQGKA